MPPWLLPPLKEGEQSDSDRKNLRIENSHGTADLEIWVTGKPVKEGDEVKRAELYIKGAHTWLTVKLVSVSPFRLSSA
jgi:hypothetical protein